MKIPKNKIRKRKKKDEYSTVDDVLGGQGTIDEM